MKFNFLKSKKGQAFSTFQLLIAAVVALAILALLLPMITSSINIGTSPNDSMNSLLKTAPNEPGNLIKSDEVKFSAKQTEYISTKSIIKGTGISSEQVRFLIPESCSNNFDIGESDGAILHIRKNESVKYQIAVLCDYELGDNDTGLIKSFNDYGLDHDMDITEIEFTDPNATCCIIYPIKK